MDTNEITSAKFNSFLAEKKLMASKCKDCGALFLPPRAICPTCRKSEMEWAEVSGKGKLAAFTCISVPPTFMCDEGFGRDNPYCSGIVETVEGPKICARILGVEPKDPESIKVGTPVNLEISERGEGDQKVAYLAFRVSA